MDDGSGLGSRANALSGNWSQFGSTEDEILAGIDSHFGAGSNEAILWRCIYRNGIPLSSTSTGIGEVDYTMGSGWMYSINESLYPGKGLSEYKLSDGDTLCLRFTLAYGKDIGGSTSGGGYGRLASYCGMWSTPAHCAKAHIPKFFHPRVTNTTTLKLTALSLQKQRMATFCIPAPNAVTSIPKRSRRLVLPAAAMMRRNNHENHI